MAQPAHPTRGPDRLASGNWLRIWTPEMYEPDYVTRQTYVGGGIEYLNGWLYFMTMHIPGNAADVHANCALPPLNNPLPLEYCYGPTQGSVNARPSAPPPPGRPPSGGSKTPRIPKHGRSNCCMARPNCRNTRMAHMPFPSLII